MSEFVQLLTPEGERVEHSGYDYRGGPDQIRSLYRDMVLVRRFDAEATALQRHGELGLWAPLVGQEAAQVGAGRALRPQDHVFPTYREHGVAWCRGVDPLQVLSLFFLIGVIAGRHHALTHRWLETFWLPALVPFVLLLSTGAHDQPAARWMTAALSIVALPGLMRATEGLNLSLFETLGRYTFIIYLTNTAFIGLVKAASFQLGLWQASHFPMIAVVMTVVAIGGAILLKRHLLPLVPALDRITT